MTCKVSCYPDRKSWLAVVDMLDLLQRLRVMASTFDANYQMPFGEAQKFEVWIVPESELP
jgi:hypothetical protein